MTKTSKRETLCSGETFEHEGHVFRFEIEPDLDSGEPWKECDGHGVISDWTSRSKSAGEKVLAEDHNSFRYYDIAETIKLATKDGWGLGPEDLVKLEHAIGHKPTKRQIIEASVRQDYQRMRDWCNDQWSWVGVVVTLLKADEDADGGYFDTKHTSSLWSIESDSEDYLTDVAYELAEELINTKEQ